MSHAAIAALEREVQDQQEKLAAVERETANVIADGKAAEEALANQTQHVAELTEAITMLKSMTEEPETEEPPVEPGTEEEGVF